MPKTSNQKPVDDLLEEIRIKLQKPEPDLIALCDKMESEGHQRIVDLLDEAIDCMSQAFGALDRARAKLRKLDVEENGPRYWIDLNPLEKPFGEETRGIVDEEAGGVVAYCGTEEQAEALCRAMLQAQGATDR